MPRASKSKPKPEPEPTGPRLVRKSAPKQPVEPAGPPEVTHDQIALRAYELFVREGSAHGHHLDHWLRAERELMDVSEVRSTRRIAETRAR
jgi:hypothetical protein